MPPENPVLPAYGRFRDGVVDFHVWRDESTLAVKAMMVVGWAFVMALLAQLQFPTQPVPFTMQVFGVLLGAVLLGTRKGVAAQALYVGAGFAGVPWFAGFQSGGQVVFTAGYLVGFVLAAIFVGLAVHALRIRSYTGLVGVMAIGSAIIFLCGWLWLAYAAPLPTGGHGLGAHGALLLGVIPFIPFDVAKVFMAAGLAVPFLPYPAPSRAPPPA